MAKNNNLTDFLTDIADTIRETDGSTSSIDPQDFSTRIVKYQNKTVTPTNSEQTITKGTGYMALGTVTVKANSEGPKATVTSGTSYSSISKTITYDSTNTRYNVALSGTVSAPTVGTAGYISSTAGTKNTSTATGSTTLPKIALGAAISGTVAATPVIANTTASVSGKTQISVTPSTSTTGIDTYYMAVSSAANKNTITATPSVATAGYGDTTNYDKTNATASAGANASGTYYIPVASADVTVSGGGLSKGTASGGGLSGGGLTAGTGEVSITQNPDITPFISGSGVNSSSQTKYGVTSTKPSGTDSVDYITLDPDATVNKEAKAKGRGSVSRAAVTRAAFSQSVSRAAVTDVREAGWLPDRESTTVISGDSTTVSLAADSTTIPATSATSNYSSESTSTSTVNAGTNYYIPIVNPVFDGGGLTGNDISATQTKGSVTIAESGTFFTKTGYGVTTTKPSGTDGTNYLTVDETHTAGSGSATGSTTITRGAVLYNGAVHGVVNKADDAQALGSTTKTVNATITVTPSVTDNFEPYYIPIVTPAFDGGGLSGDNISGSQTKGSVTIAEDGTFFSSSGYGVTTTKPSGTDGTNYLTVGETHSTSSGSATGSTTITRGAVLYNGAVHGAVNVVDDTQALGSDTKTVSASITVTPSVTDNFEPYYIPIVSPAFDGGALTGGGAISPSVTAPTVEYHETGTFVDSTKMTTYGITTSKPSGTDGTDYLTVDATHTESNGSVSGSKTVKRNAVLYNGAVHGAVNKADDATALAADTTGTAVSVSATVDPAVTDNFEPYYVPIKTASATGGTASASASQTGMTAGVSSTETSYYFTSSASATGGSASVGKGITAGASASGTSASDSSKVYLKGATATGNPGTITYVSHTQDSTNKKKFTVTGSVSAPAPTTTAGYMSAGSGSAGSATNRTVSLTITDAQAQAAVGSGTATGNPGTITYVSHSQDSTNKKKFTVTGSVSAPAPTVSAGYISSGTAGSATNRTVSLTLTDAQAQAAVGSGTATGKAGSLTYSSHTQDTTDKKKFTVTASVSAPAPTVSAGYIASGTAGSAENKTVSLTITDAQAQAAVGSGTATVQDRTSGGSAVGYGKEVSLTAGYYAAQKFYNSIGAGTIDVTDLTITPNALSGSWDSTNNKYVVSQASKTATMQSTVTTAGYVSDTVGTKNTGTATVSAPSNLNIPKATFTTSDNTVSVATAGYIYSGTVGTVATGTITNDTTLPSGSTSSGNLSYNKYIKIGAGYYASDVYYKNGVSAGSATTPTASGASTSTSLSGTTLTVARSVTPTVVAGYVSSGTAGTVTITGTVPTETKSASGAGDITPSSGKLLSKVTVGAGSATTPATSITANPGSPTWNSSTSKYDISVSATKSVTPTVNAGWVASGTAGTITVSGASTLNQSTWTAEATPSGQTPTNLSFGGTYTLAAGYYPNARYYKVASPSGNIQLTQSSSTDVTNYATATVATAPGAMYADSSGSTTNCFSGGGHRLSSGWTDSGYYQVRMSEATLNGTASRLTLNSGTITSVGGTASITNLGDQYSTAAVTVNTLYGTINVKTNTNGAIYANYNEDDDGYRAKIIGNVVYAAQGNHDTVLTAVTDSSGNILTASGSNASAMGTATYLSTGNLTLSTSDTASGLYFTPYATNLPTNYTVSTAGWISAGTYGGSGNVIAGTSQYITALTVASGKTLSSIVNNGGTITSFSNGGASSTTTTFTNTGTITNFNLGFTGIMTGTITNLYGEGTVTRLGSSTTSGTLNIVNNGYSNSYKGTLSVDTNTYGTIVANYTDDALDYRASIVGNVVSVALSNSDYASTAVTDSNGNLIQASGDLTTVQGATTDVFKGTGYRANNGWTNSGNYNAYTKNIQVEGTAGTLNLNSGTITSVVGSGTINTYGDYGTALSTLTINNNGYNSSYKGNINIKNNTNGTVAIYNPSAPVPAISISGTNITIPIDSVTLSNSGTVSGSNSGTFGSSTTHFSNTGTMYLTSNGSAGNIYFKNSGTNKVLFKPVSSGKLKLYYTAYSNSYYVANSSSTTRYVKTLSNTLNIGSTTYYVIGYWSGTNLENVYFTNGQPISSGSNLMDLTTQYIRFYSTSSSTAITSGSNSMYFHYDSTNKRIYLLTTSSTFNVGSSLTIYIAMSNPIILGCSSSSSLTWTAGSNSASSSSTIYRVNYVSRYNNSNTSCGRCFMIPSSTDHSYYYVIDSFSLSASSSTITGTLNTSVMNLTTP